MTTTYLILALPDDGTEVRTMLPRRAHQIGCACSGCESGAPPFDDARELQPESRVGCERVFEIDSFRIRIAQR